MALTVTPGSATADSYATLAEANTYHTDHGTTAWTGTDALKENALRRAVDWLDFTYRTRFSGSRADDRDQNLEWPRDNAYDIADVFIVNTEIPIEIKRAQIEAALRELVAPGSLSPDYTASEQLKSLDVFQVVKREFFGGGENVVLPVLHIVDGILSGLIGGDTNFLLRA